MRRPNAGIELHYVVDLDDTHSGHGLVVRPFWRVRQANGRWSARKPYDAEAEGAPVLTDPLDRRLYRVLAAARRSKWTETSQLSKFGGKGALWLEDNEVEAALPLLGESGRAYLHHRGSIGEVPFLFDDSEPWAFGVRLDRQGKNTRLTGFLARGESRLKLKEPALVLQGFVFLERSVSKLDARGAWPLLETLLRDGALEGSGDDGDELAQRMIDLPAHPLLEGDGLEVAEALEPALDVRVLSREEGEPSDVHIRFGYGDAEVGPSDPRGAVRDSQGRVLRRNWKAERSALEALLSSGAEPSRGQPGVDAKVPPATADELVLGVLEHGGEAELDGRACRLTAAPDIEVREEDGGWVLDGELAFEGGRASLPRLLASLTSGVARLDLDDGSIGLLPTIVRREWSLLATLGRREGESLSFQSSQGWLLDKLLGERPGVRWGESFAKLRERLSGYQILEPREEPESFQGTLRSYQRLGVAWFEFLEQTGFGGCLADEMGLGKTVMVLSHLEARRLAGEGPSLVVAPRSLLFNWRREAERFTPELRVLDHTGPDRDPARIADHDLVLTTYGTLRSDVKVLGEQPFDYVVLDEAQAIKNASSHTAKAARLLNASHRLALSGTPIENHLRELWSLFEFLNPGMLGQAPAFRGLFMGRGERRLDPEGQRLLSTALRPFLLRRTKEEVLPDLPPRVEQTLTVEMGEAQRAEYEALEAHYRSLLEKMEGSRDRGVAMLRALLRLRQAACHPGLMDAERTPETSAKLDVLLPHLQEIIESGHKALVFSQFSRHLGVVREHIEQMDIEYSWLDGQTRNREEVVKRFREDPNCPLFLMTLKAGGLGLNLVEADYVFLLDPWWNPAAEAQAIDRAHRIGRTGAVMAYRLVARDTVEERVIELQKEKRALASAVLPTGSDAMKKLSFEDLSRLFG